MSVFWLGGGSGAGKTTLARTVAGRLDLRVYHVDAYGFDHVARMVTGPFPRTQAFNAMTYDERWIRAPEVLAEEFLAISRERMPLITDDLAALGPGATILVEGPQLLPDIVAPLLEGAEGALWLLPTESFSRRAVAARGEVVPSAREAEVIENRYRRDVLIADAIREQAAALSLRSFLVDGQRSLSATADWLAQALADVAGGLIRAVSGEQRSLMRRQENLVMVTQLRLYWEAMGRTVMPQPPVGPFACECTTLGCDSEVSLPLDEYLRVRAAGPLQTH